LKKRTCGLGTPKGEKNDQTTRVVQVSGPGRGDRLVTRGETMGGCLGGGKNIQGPKMPAKGGIQSNLDRKGGGVACKGCQRSRLFCGIQKGHA